MLEQYSWRNKQQHILQQHLLLCLPHRPAAPGVVSSIEYVGDVAVTMVCAGTESGAIKDPAKEPSSAHAGTGFGSGSGSR